jgi:hypothetical protein
MIVSGRMHIPVAATYPISSVKQAVADATPPADAAPSAMRDGSPLPGG